MKLIDTHTHLYTKEFDADRTSIVQSAIDKGVAQFYLPNIDIESMPQMIQLVDEFPNHCFPMLGLHPCSVNQDYINQLAEIETWYQKTKFYAIGEIGIDLYWEKEFKDQQIDAFKIQIEWAKKYKLPIVIHVRDAFNEVFEVLDEMNDDTLTGIFHCFTGDEDQAKKVLSYGGFKLGIGGVVTFKNSGLDKSIANIGLEHLVLETDSPYLAPTPFRGKRNESSYLLNIADRLSDIHQLSIEEISKITTANALAIFKNTLI